MKKILVMFAFCFSLGIITNAQNTLKENLSKHVHRLASDEMKGRALGTKEMDNAANYIKEQLKNIGLTVVEFNVLKDSLDNFVTDNESYSIDSKEVDIAVEKESRENIIYKNFYTIIPTLDSTNIDKYTMLSAKYIGGGIDTIKQYAIINNSANSSASACAALIELAKYFKENQSKLKKNLIIFFNGGIANSIACEYFSKRFDKGSIELDIFMDALGYLAGNPTEWQYSYIVSSKIQNASKILQPILLKDVNFPTTADYENWTDFPTMKIEGDYLYSYLDVPDSLNYDMMEKIVNQSKEVILAFNTTILQIDYSKHKRKDYGDLFFETSDKSYFGINLMIGSNKHYYSEGRMTGKAAMSYSAGMFFKWQFNKFWALKIDANYERAYANRHDGRFASDVLSVPITFMSAIGSKNIEFLQGLGVYYDYNLSAKLDDKSVSWDDFNRGEWGIQFSLGFSFGSFMIGYYQKLGLSDFMTSRFTHSGKLYNRNQYFTIGWHF